MPFQIMDSPGLSSSSYSSESLPNERQVGFWKSNNMSDGFVSGNSVASSPMEKLVPVESQTMKSQHPESFLIQDQRINFNLNRHAVGAGRASSHSLTLNTQPASYSEEGNKINMMGAQYESSLFSSSLSDLFSRKLRLSSNNTLYGHSIDTVASHYEEEEPFDESLEEIEAQTIGNLLPDDDDLLSGVTDGLDCIVQPSGGDDVEDLDFFSSVGGLDLGDDGSSAGQNNSEFPGVVSNGQPGASNGSIANEHPSGEHPSRTLFVRNINSNVEDSELRALFEHYGNIRTLYTACKHRGFVMISYYDIRAARNAMKALQNKPLRRRKLDIHYSIPKDNPSEKDINQGTLVVFNLDSSVSNDELRQIFGVYGEIKEIRETPHRSHHKFIEFYDVRAAEAALRALNRSDIAGKQIKLEPSCPGGSRRLMQQIPPELEHDDGGPYLQQNSPPIDLAIGFSGSILHGAITSGSMDHGTVLGACSAIQAPSMETALHHAISSSVPNSLPSLVKLESFSNQIGLAESGCSPGQLKFDIRGTPTFHPHSLPEYQDGLTNGVQLNSPGTVNPNINPSPPERFDNRQLRRVSSNGHPVELNEPVFGSAGNGSCPLSGHQYTWNSSYHRQPPGMMWPNSPSFVNGICGTHPAPRLHAPPRPSNMLNSVLPINTHHVGSAPAVNPSLWDRRHAYAGESPKANGFHPGSLENMRMSTNSLHGMEFVSHGIFPHVGGNCMDLHIPPKNIGLQSHHQRCMIFSGGGQMIPMMNSFDSPIERSRSRRNEGGSSQAENKKQYELDIDRIMRGEDNRTTLMIKNIPNKYTSKMLLAAIDERHRGTYDFTRTQNTTTTSSMATTNGPDSSGILNEKDGISNEPKKEAAPIPNPEAKHEETEIKARVDAMWEQMNKGIPNKTPNFSLNMPRSTVNKKSKNSSTNYMAYLGLAPKKTGSIELDSLQKEPSVMQDSTSEEAKRLAAAAALSAVKDAAAATAAATGRGKVEITEVRDFAGQEIEVKKLVDADSKEASEKAKGAAPSAVDAVLEQIKKKQKLSVLDKSKKDWGEFKEEKGLEEELDAYKKSSNQYLEKVSFLQRTDYREFERERDARLAQQAKRRTDMREEP